MPRAIYVGLGTPPRPPVGGAALLRGVADRAGLTDARTVTPTVGGGGGGSLRTITHGDQLLVSDVGPWALQGVAKGSEAIWSPTPTGNYWRMDAPQWGNWPAPTFPTGTYVYNNNPSNHGGYVPAGGLTIDGLFYPAGTYVIQFADVSPSFYVTDFNAPILLRGCRARATSRAPGTVNISAEFTGGTMGIHFCDAGGLGDLDAQYDEVPFGMNFGTRFRALRNYVSYTTTGLQWNVATGTVLENYITNLVEFYGPNPPPGESTNKHLNGITTNGGSCTAAWVARNNITLPTPLGRATSGSTPREVNQTDAISFFQDFGTFPGSGTNEAGTAGYLVEDNYIGGGTYPLYAGKNNGSPDNSVQNFVLRRNRWTTQWWSTGGALGPVSAVPPWGSYGNSQTDNRWADGPNAGLLVL